MRTAHKNLESASGPAGSSLFRLPVLSWSHPVESGRIAMKHLPKLLLWLPAALWYRVIWGFSAQTAAVSGDLSDRLL